MGEKKAWYKSKMKLGTIGWGLLSIAETVFPEYVAIIQVAKPVLLTLAGIGARDAMDNKKGSIR